MLMATFSRTSSTQMPFAPMPGTYMMPQGGTPTHHPVNEIGQVMIGINNRIFSFLSSNYRRRSIRHSTLRVERIRHPLASTSME